MTFGVLWDNRESRRLPNSVGGGEIRGAGGGGGLLVFLGTIDNLRRVFDLVGAFVVALWVRGRWRGRGEGFTER